MCPGIGNFDEFLFSFWRAKFFVEKREKRNSNKLGRRSRALKDRVELKQKEEKG